jgi:hypothetical protein
VRPRFGRRPAHFGGGGLGVEFADSSLQFQKLLVVFFCEVVELFMKLGLPEIQRNDQNRRGEQRQPIDHVQKIEKGHGLSSGVLLG